MTIIEINEKHFRRRCMMPISDFEKGATTVEYNAQGLATFFFDNGADVLAVAHLDTVAQHDLHFYRLAFGNEHLIFSPGLDDRAGVYTIMDLLPSLGIHCDILLTDGEETGRSTARTWKPPHDRKYNWMFSFDRAKGDVVMYQYENPKARAMLQKHGFIAGRGSYSDIASLSDLGCLGFNFGVGYDNYHTIYSCITESVMLTSVRRFYHFYQEHKDEHLPYQRGAHGYSATSGRSYYGTGYENDYEEYSYWRQGSQKNSASKTQGTKARKTGINPYSRDYRYYGSKDTWLCPACGAKMSEYEYAERGVCAPCYFGVDLLKLSDVREEKQLLLASGDKEGTTQYTTYAPCKVCGTLYDELELTLDGVCEDCAEAEESGGM